jgi:hypothetical protein
MSVINLEVLLNYGNTRSPTFFIISTEHDSFVACLCFTESARPAAHEHTEISNISTDIMSLPGSLQWEDDMEMYSHFLDRKVDDISQTVSV